VQVNRSAISRIVLGLGLGIGALFVARPVSIVGQGPASAHTLIRGRRAIAGDVLVKFRRTLHQDEQDWIKKQVNGDRNERVGGSGVRLIHSKSQDTESLLNFLQHHPDVVYAEPNYVIQASTVPNDTRFGELWGLLNSATPGADIGATLAWSASTGSTASVIGVVDSGIDYTHPDLAANIWSAPQAFTVTVAGWLPITCAAGTHGFNAISNTCDPMDNNNHGTHVAGTIGAVGNNGSGVAGVNWSASMMALKFLDSSGNGTTDKAINAIDFAIQVKATLGTNVRVLSNSWGGGGFSQALVDEINRANSADMLFVASAGNSGTNNDTTPFYPASYTAPNILSVTATDSADQRWSSGNYGATTVHLGAPGVSILSTIIGGNYAYATGTSMATPHVAGAAALLLSRCTLDTPNLKSYLLNNVDLIPAMSGVTSSGGRLNVNKALQACIANNQSTAVRLTTFTAAATGGGVRFDWHTGYEADNLGFRIYAERPQGRVQLTPGLIAGSSLGGGKTGGPGGYTYSWFRADPLATSRSTYWLEAVDLHGKSEWYGPFKTSSSQTADAGTDPSKLLNQLATSNGSHSAPNVAGASSGFSAGPSQSAGPDQIAASTAPPSIVRTTADTKEMRSFLSRLGANQTTSDPAMLRQWAIEGGRAVKIDVKTTGWYQVGASALLAAGIDPNTRWDQLHLVADGTEVPLLVTSKQPDRVNTGDTIEFYGTGADTPYTDTHVYWLVAGSDHGDRVRMVDGRTADAPQSASFPFTVTRQDRTIYFAALANGDADSYFGDVIAGDPVDETLTLRHVAAAGTAVLEVALQGVTDSTEGARSGAGHHNVQVRVNGLYVGTITFAGQSTGLARFRVPSAQLVEGANRITLQSTGGDLDISLVEYVRLTYEHTFDVDDGQFVITIPGGEAVTLRGFAAPPRLFDVTDPRSPREIQISLAGPATSYRVAFKSHDAGARRILVVARNSVLSPAAVRANNPSRWQAADQAADYVIITHAAFRTSLTPLLERRAQQGHKTALIDVEDLYDEFAFGQKSPWAIKAFLINARAVWATPPRFVVLVGNASADPRNYLRAAAADPTLDYVPDADFVPTKIVTTRALKTASDDWFGDADEDGIPELAIGRLSVLTAKQASAVVAKLLAYERMPIGAWTKNVLLVADAKDPDQPDFESLSRALESTLPANYSATEVFADRIGSTRAAEAAISAKVAEGEAVINFVGHGSVDVWGKSADLLTRDDVNGWHNARLPFVVAMNCLTGFFQGPFPEESMAETLQRSPDGGAVAVWGSSGMTDAATQSIMNRELFRQIFGGAATFGDAVLASKRAVTDLDVRRTWIFFGDPAMRLLGAPAQVAPTSSLPGSHVAASDSGVSGGGSATPVNGSLSGGNASTLRLVDANGDLRSDLWLYNPSDGTWFALPGAGDAGGEWHGIWPADARIAPARLNDDRYADVVIASRAGDDWWQGLGRGDGQFIWTRGAWPHPMADAVLRTADLRGIGRDDVVAYSPKTGQWTVGLSDGRGAFKYVDGRWPADAELHVGDVNGDGLEDIVGYQAKTGHAFLAISLGAGRFQTVETDWEAGATVLLANLDGHGVRPIVYDAATGAWTIRAAINAGTVMVARGVWLRGLSLHAADFTGDGRDDVFGYDADSGVWMLAVTRAVGRFDVQTGGWSDGWSIAVGDVSGDGRADVALYDPASGIAFLAITQDPGVFEYRPLTLPPGETFVGEGR
jgi:subtilisin family serine protease